MFRKASEMGKLMKSKESGKTEKVFAFLRLPGELRTEVYRNIFFVPLNLLFPDTTGSRKFRSCNHDLGEVEESHPLSVSILQTCRQINEEAAPILYGPNIFAFTSHTVCKNCVRLQSQTNRQNPVPPPMIQTDCGLQLMYTWLCVIGSTNRALIQIIHLAVEDAAYLYYDGEPRLVDDLQTGLTLGKPAAQFLGKAFDLMSKKHSLRQIMIIFGSSDPGSLNSHFCYNGMESKLFIELMKINGPKFRFRSWPLPEEKSHLELLKQLKKKIARVPKTKAKTAVVKLREHGLVILPPKKPQVREKSSVPVLAEANWS